MFYSLYNLHFALNNSGTVLNNWFEKVLTAVLNLFNSSPSMLLKSLISLVLSYATIATILSLSGELSPKTGQHSENVKSEVFVICHGLIYN